MVDNPMETPPAQNLPAVPDANQNPAPKPKRGLLPHGCLPWGFAAFVVLVLLGIILPLFNSVAVRGPQTRALAQAKQAGLALKLFAGDHDGHYPGQGVPVEMREAPRNSNQTFACLFPTYTQSETIFGNKFSAYQTGNGPDNRIDPQYTGRPVETLRPGENVYGYVMGLTDDSNPDAPLVVDGSDGSGHYNKVEGLRGGTWKGGKAIVIHLDNSGAIENLRGTDNSLYIPRSDDPARNALDTGYLGKDVRYLDPAVAGP